MIRFKPSAGFGGPMKQLITILLVGFLALNTGAQEPYRIGSKVADIQLPLVLNSTAPATTLNSLRGPITILDFFGTWCVPCIRSLPHLRALQAARPDSLKVVLISIEPEARLRAFLAKEPQPFPLIVDAGESISRRFAPPSYPYTLVLDDQGTIIAVTEAAMITGNAIRDWLAGRDSGTLTTSGTHTATAGPATPVQAPAPSANAVVKLSQDFVYAARTGDVTDNFRRQLAALNNNELVGQLKTDNEKKAFWLNLYNGFVQALLRADTARYSDRKQFFGSKQFTVAGHNLSLDDIEHGILRHSRSTGRGNYFSNVFPDSFERQQRVSRVDYRVHFALNCGARSCPPIAFYRPEDIDHQLDLATDNYLKNEVVSSPSDNLVDLPAIMGWFRADFGGRKGIRQLLEKKGLIPAGSNPRMRFQPYDWTLELNTKVL
jgi:peroxiredoxin